MNAKTYSIGELCAEFGVTPRTQRFYECKELLAPIRDGQRRLFTCRDRARLKLILRGRRFGFSLDEMKDLLDLYDVDRTGVIQLTAIVATGERNHAELIAKRDELTAAIGDLEQQLGEARRLLDEHLRTNAAA